MRFLGSLSRPLVRASGSRIAASPARVQPPKLPRFRRHTSSTASHEPEQAEPSEHDLRYGYYDVILPEEPYVWGTSHIIPRGVPPHIRRPPYVPDRVNPEASTPEEGPAATARKLITDTEDLVRLRRAAQLAAKTLQFAGTLVQVGITTDKLDAEVHEFILAHGAYPSPLGYKGFPKACCTSVNNIVAHGIPDDRPLQDGDIVNVDVTVYLDGFHGDTSKTFLIGDVDEKGRELVSVTEAALEAGIAVCGPGRPFKGIAQAIREVIRGKDFSVSPMFTGHGIGREFHRRPWIYHDVNHEPGVMEPGDCFTIEPAVVQGDDPSAVTYPDGWTVSTENCARSAQAEHMVLITDVGAEVLTRPT
ncbi:methionine aminopeptidase [Lentinus tigrinus ALCF2SS1-7]|uniref:Methionine aminopeptidase n=1 Tax=Lentinus tigrinus ALCF2SS1-6 TaxID=1328759 RepID=A0A5C2T6X6_9APHY|nr:methionine aminopeptidase [Lentinus tigrinus ALCF2SS1-6]RPD81375.1 methionine aminopeptidase [Lentinus tigrinus ALCF2SS1-7]